MSNFNIIQQIAIWALPVLFAVTLHEVAHGYVAHLRGDQTAYRQGRLSLNPIRHVDPIGTILVPGLLLATGSGFLFGWAKPVPVAMRNLEYPRRDMALVAVAGPLANFAMALFWGLLLKLAFAVGNGGLARGLLYMSGAGIMINLVLMILNLIPIPPLDGSRVLSAFLPEQIARQLDRLEPYGLLLVVALLATGALSRIMTPALMLAQTVLLAILGIHDIRVF